MWIFLCKDSDPDGQSPPRHTHELTSKSRLLCLPYCVADIKENVMKKMYTKLLVNACAPRYQILSSQSNYMLISQCTMIGFNQAQLNDGKVEYKLTNESDRTQSSHRIIIFAVTKTTSSMGFSSSTLLYLKSCIISQDKSNTNWLKKVEMNSTVRITFAAFFAVTKDCVFNRTFEFNLPSHSYYIISPRQVESKLTSESGDELDSPITFATNFVVIKHCESCLSLVLALSHWIYLK